MIHSCVRTEFDSYLSLKAQTFNCKNKKTNTFSDCRFTSNQRTAPSVRQNPPRSRAVKWPLHYKQSIRGDGDGQTGGRWQWTHHSPPALAPIRRESISQPWRCPHTLCCTTWVKPAEQVEPALLMWIHSELRVSCYITDAWILMTALLGALFSSLLRPDVHSDLYCVYCEAPTQTIPCFTRRWVRGRFDVRERGDFLGITGNVLFAWRSSTFEMQSEAVIKCATV